MLYLKGCLSLPTNTNNGRACDKSDAATNGWFNSSFSVQFDAVYFGCSPSIPPQLSFALNQAESEMVHAQNAVLCVRVYGSPSSKTRVPSTFHNAFPISFDFHIFGRTGLAVCNFDVDYSFEYYLCARQDGDNPRKTNSNKLNLAGKNKL